MNKICQLSAAYVKKTFKYPQEEVDTRQERDLANEQFTIFQLWNVNKKGNINTIQNLILFRERTFAILFSCRHFERQNCTIEMLAFKSYTLQKPNPETSL